MGVLFIVCGLISLGVAIAIYMVYQIFFTGDTCTIVGKVVDIVANEHISKDAWGRVNDVTETSDPIVEFCYARKYYHFQATSFYLPSKSLHVGSTVNVVINEQKYPNVAKLAEEATAYKILMMVFGLLAGIFIIVGIRLVNFSDFVDSLSNLFTLVWLVGVVLFIGVTAKKVLRMAKNGPLFPENMTEVAYKDISKNL